jgi:hypothetical protein
VCLPHFLRARDGVLRLSAFSHRGTMTGIVDVAHATSVNRARDGMS